MRSLTGRPFGVNVFMAEAVLKTAVPVFLEKKPAVVYADILSGLGRELCQRYFTPMKDAGIKIVVKASTLQDALTAQETGADIVVAKGWKGGHVTPESTIVLFPQVAAALDIPVVGAGGIMDGRGMAAAITPDAEGIEMGTAFLCAEECTIAPAAKQAIVDAADMHSRVTAASILEPCRQLQNAFTDRMEDLELNHPVSEVADEMHRLAGPSLKRAMHDGDTENGAVMASPAAPLIKSIRPAAEIIGSTIDEFRHIASKMGSFDLEA